MLPAFFISLKYYSNAIYEVFMYQNLQCFFFYLMRKTKIYKIFLRHIGFNEVKVIIQFENIRDKNFVEFMLKRWNDINLAEKENNPGQCQLNSSEKVELPDLSSYMEVYTYQKAYEFFYQGYQVQQNFQVPQYAPYGMQTVIQGQAKAPGYPMNFQNSQALNRKENLLRVPNEDSKKNQMQIEDENISVKNEKPQPNPQNASQIQNNEQNFGGIKQRSIPAEDRKKYLIKPERIINELDQRTTIMIKNIPKFVNQSYMIKFFREKFDGEFNFFYLPVDFTKNQNVGYAFMNFRNCRKIIQFYLEYNEKPWPFQKKIKCYISYARIQGFKSISQHFEKSNIMNQSKEEFKPFITEV